MFISEQDFYKQSHSIPREDNKGWFEGFIPAALKAPVSGVALGAGIAAAAGEEYFRPEKNPEAFNIEQLSKMQDDEIESALRSRYEFNSDELADLFSTAQEKATSVVKWAKPGAATTGAASQLVFGIGQILTAGAVGGAAGGVTGAVASIGATQGFNTFLEVEEQTHDKEIARRAGWYSALANMVGAGAPAYIGKTLAVQVGTGAAINLAVGMAERGSIGQYLKSEGYEKAAQNWEVLDGQAAAADIILGMAFPFGARAIHAVKGKKAQFTQDQIDAAIALTLERNAEARLPEIPTDPVKLDEASAKVANDTIDLFVNGKSVFDIEPPKTDGLPNPELGEAIRVADEATNTIIKNETGVDMASHSADIAALEQARKSLDEAREEPEAAKDIPAEKVTPEDTAVTDKAKMAEENITPEMIVSRRAKALADNFPDMVVRVEGKDVPLSDLMKMVDELKADADIDASLHRTAIACAMRFI